MVGSVSTSSLIGVAMSCGGNVVISLALTIQKLAHRRQRDELELERENSSDDLNSEGGPHRSLISNTSPASPDRRARVNGDGATQDPSHGAALLSSPLHQDAGVGVGVLPDNDGDLVEGDLVPIVVVAPTPDGKSNRTLEGPVPVQTHVRIQTPTAKRQGSQSSSEGDGNGKVKVEEGAYLKSKLWWLGLGLIALGEGGNFLSYGFAPASVVAPLGTVALIANCLFAPLILRERFHPRELLGMGLAIVGAITVVYSSSDRNPRLDPDQLLQAISQIPFIVYTSLTVGAILTLMLLSTSTYGETLIGIDVGTCALFGGYTVLSTKALSSLLSTMFLAAFGWGITWLLVAILVGTSVMQIKYLNRALMRFESKFVFFSLAAIIGSAVLYQEFRDITFSQLVNFGFGIGTTFLGVHLLTSYHSTPASPESSPPESPKPSSMHRHSLSLSEHSTLLAVPPPLLRRTTSTTSNVPRQVRIVRRGSQGDFKSTLGLNTTAGFLLLATTPPATGSLGRGRSLSRASRIDEEEEGTGAVDQSSSLR